MKGYSKGFAYRESGKVKSWSHSFNRWNVFALSIKILISVRLLIKYEC